MRLDRVTITGADDSISPEVLVPISAAYPFAEWGILLSLSRWESPRFPSRQWIYALQDLGDVHALALSLHLCGAVAQDLLAGDILTFPVQCAHGFQRIQLNHGGKAWHCEATRFPKALAWLGAQREYIFQISEGIGLQSLEMYLEDYGNAVPLLDCSHGTGNLPRIWPRPFLHANDKDYAYHGYAGGLGPDNLADELPRIAEAAGNCRIWIDMETGVRSDDNRRFDLEKVVQCLEIAQPYVTSAEVPHA